MKMTLSDRLRHFFHVVSNVRPIIWIASYIALTPVFAVIYWLLPDGQFRIPDGAGTDFGSWLYYSIVTITTLGFGDYTPAHGMAQCVTAVEVMCGLVILGLFLNAVGSMKSEIDVASELQKQRLLHHEAEKEKLAKSAPMILHGLNMFLSYAYAITTPADKRESTPAKFSPDFQFNDMTDLFKPSGLDIDHSSEPVVKRFLSSASSTSLMIDSLSVKIDLSLWPDLVDDCFDFVANYQMFSSSSSLVGSDSADRISKAIAEWKGPVSSKEGDVAAPAVELYHFIKENGDLALKIVSALTRIINDPSDQQQ